MTCLSNLPMLWIKKEYVFSFVIVSRFITVFFITVTLPLYLVQMSSSSPRSTSPSSRYSYFSTLLFSSSLSLNSASCFRGHVIYSERIFLYCAPVSKFVVMVTRRGRGK